MFDFLCRIFVQDKGNSYTPRIYEKTGFIVICPFQVIICSAVNRLFGILIKAATLFSMNASILRANVINAHKAQFNLPNILSVKRGRLHRFFFCSLDLGILIRILFHNLGCSFILYIDLI